MNREIKCMVSNQTLTAQECLDCALKNVVPPCGYDYMVLKKLFADEHRGEVHVTHLTGCLLRAYFDIVEPSPEYPHEMLVRNLGSAVHEYLEGSDERVDSELRMEAMGLVGTADVVYKNGRLLDFKTVRWIYPDKLPYSSHGLQVNIYAEMLRQMGREVTSLAIQYIDMSGPTKCRACSLPVRMNHHGEWACPSCGAVPRGAHPGAVLVEIPLMDRKEIQKFVDERRQILQDAINGEGPMPDEEPSWLCSYCSHDQKCPRNRN